MTAGTAGDRLGRARARVDPTDDGGVRVSLPSRRPTWLTFAVPVWSALALGGLLTREDAGPASLVVGPLVVAGALALWLWLVAAREELEAGDGALILRRTLGPLRFERAFPAAEIERLETVPAPRRRWSDAFGAMHASLALDHGGRSHRFAAGLDDGEARELAARLREALR
jgi:hypothetical protein